MRYLRHGNSECEAANTIETSSYGRKEFNREFENALARRQIIGDTLSTPFAYTYLITVWLNKRFTYCGIGGIGRSTSTISTIRSSVALFTTWCC